MTTSRSNNRTNLRTRRSRGGAGAALSLAVLFILIVYPLGTLLLQIGFPHLFDMKMNFAPSLKPIENVFTQQGNLKAVLNSFLMGLLAAIMATAIGTVTAFASVRSSERLRGFVNICVWIVFFAPSYIVAEGWVVLMQDGGIAAQIFGLQNGWSAWFFTRFGLVLAMGLRYFPFVHMAMEQAIENVGGDLLNAGRLFGANRMTIFRRIHLPLLTPALLAGASIAFAEGFGDFGFAAAITPQVHIPLLSYQIYTALNQAPVDYPSAAGLSLLLIMVTGSVLIFQMWWMGRKSYATVSSSTKVHVPNQHRRVSAVLICAFFILLIALVLPIASTGVESLLNSDSFNPGMAWTTSNYAHALQIGGDGIQAMTRSLMYALVAAVFTAMIGVYVAYQMMFRKSAVTRILNMFTMATIAIPGVVLAASFIFAWNAVWLIPVHLVLYGTPMCLAMAYIAGHLPYGIRLQVGAMTQLSPNLVTAARVLAAKDNVVLRRIVIPLVSATTISTFFLTFTDTVFELPASSLLYPAGQPPFPVLVDSKFMAFEWGQGAALAMMGLVVVFGFYLIGRLVTNWVENRVAMKGAVFGGTSEVHPGVLPGEGDMRSASVNEVV